MNTIKQFLHEKGLTQGQVAELLGYSQNYVNQVANGKMEPTSAFRWRWQEAFGSEALRVLNGGNHDTLYLSSRRIETYHDDDNGWCAEIIDDHGDFAGIAIANSEAGALRKAQNMIEEAGRDAGL